MIGILYMLHVVHTTRMQEIDEGKRLIRGPIDRRIIATLPERFNHHNLTSSRQKCVHISKFNQAIAVDNDRWIIPTNQRDHKFL